MGALIPVLIQSALVYGPGFVRDVIALLKKDPNSVTVADLDALFHEGLKNSYDSYIAGTNVPLNIPATTPPPTGGGK